jgi:hypothetical protein
MNNEGRFCKRFIVFGMGFKQRQTKNGGNGIVELASDTRRYLHTQGVLYDTLTRVVRWNADCKELAASIEAVAVKDPEWTKKNPKYDCTVEIYSYSWGCGRMAKRLMKELAKRNIQVRQIVFCDPVYHSFWLHNRWLALLPTWSFIKKLWLRIPITGDVKSVTRFYQKNNVPAGFKIKNNGAYEKHYDLTDKGYKHNDMDNAPEFQENVMGYIAMITKERTRK